MAKGFWGNLLALSTAGVSTAFTGNNKSGGSPAPAPIPLPQAPSPVDAQAKAQDIARKKRAEMSQSIYSSPLGLAGEADVARKTLTGQ